MSTQVPQIPIPNLDITVWLHEIESKDIYPKEDVHELLAGLWIAMRDVLRQSRDAYRNVGALEQRSKGRWTDERFKEREAMELAQMAREKVLFDYIDRMKEITKTPKEK